MRSRIAFLIGFFIFICTVSIAAAWTGPTATAPGNNTAAPINVSATAQVKNGNIGVDGLAVFGNTLLGGSAGSNAYLNFGATAGATGYGIRDNAGTLQYANSSGGWQDFSSGSLAGTATYVPVFTNATTLGNSSITSAVGASTEHGNFTVTGTVFAAGFIYSSDIRLKKNIEPLTGNLSKVLALQPVSYNWINPASPKGEQIGFIAQEVQKVLPELVYTDTSTTMEALDYARLTPVLVGSVQELNQKIEAQQAQITAQQQEIDTLQAQVQELLNR